MSDSFDLSQATRVVFGEGAAQRLGALAHEVAGASARVLLVTDEGLVASGHVEHAEAALRDGGHEVRRFSDVTENPTTDDVERCASVARAFEPALFVGFGGGSCIDVAKGADFLLTNGGAMEDYRGDGKVHTPLLPLIAVPTTAGTGTEVQRFALIASAATHQKMACGDVSAAPRIAVLDPILTLSIPRRVTACTGLDAIGHAVESAVTSVRTDLSARFAAEAFALGVRNQPRVLETPTDLAARGAMLRAATLAGLAIEHSMLGAAHSMANPLTAHFDLPHGQAVGMCLPHVVRYNAEEPETAAIYAELARSAGLCEGTEASERDAVEALVAELESQLELAGMPASLAECGVTFDRCPALGDEAAEQWTAQFNPRSIDSGEFRGLFERACTAPERPRQPGR